MHKYKFEVTDSTLCEPNPMQMNINNNVQNFPTYVLNVCYIYEQKK